MDNILYYAERVGALIIFSIAVYGVYQYIQKNYPEWLQPQIPLRHFVADLIGDYWIDGIILLSTISTGVFFFLFTDEAIKYFSEITEITPSNALVFSAYKHQATIGFIVSITINFTFSIFGWKKQKRLSRLSEEISTLKKERIGSINDLNAIMFGYLGGIADNLDFNNRDRVTIYFYSEDLKGFVPHGRVAYNPLYRNYNREICPEDEGFIAVAWSEGTVFQDDLDEWGATRRRYRNPNGIGNIPDVTRRNLRMHSRLYFGYRISDSVGMTPLAVLIVESTDPKRWGKIHLETYFSSENKKLCNIMERLKPQMPELSEARETGL